MNTLQKIDAYLYNRLSKEARTAFELEMKRDPDLYRQVKSEELQLNAIEVMEELSIRQKLDELKAKALSEETAGEDVSIKKQPTSQYWIWGVLVVVLLGVGYYIFQKEDSSTNTGNQPSGDQIAQVEVSIENKYLGLAQAFYTISPPDYGGLRKSGADRINFDMEMIRVLVDQDQSRFTEAITHFASFPDNLKAQINLAHAHHLNGTYRDALRIFNKVLSQEEINSDIRVDIEYYKAASLLAIGEIQQATQLLQNIIAYDRTHAYDATLMLERLKEVSD